MSSGIKSTHVASSDGQYLNTIVFQYVFKYICVYKNQILNTFQTVYLNIIFRYNIVYLLCISKIQNVIFFNFGQI